MSDRRMTSLRCELMKFLIGPFFGMWWRSTLTDEFGRFLEKLLFRSFLRSSSHSSCCLIWSSDWSNILGFSDLSSSFSEYWSSSRSEWSFIAESVSSDDDSLKFGRFLSRASIRFFLRSSSFSLKLPDGGPFSSSSSSWLNRVEVKTRFFELQRGWFVFS